MFATDQDTGIDVDTLDDDALGEALVDLHRQRARLEAEIARVAAVFDARQGWVPSGARSAAAWLAWKARLPAGACRSTLRVARQLRHLPDTAEAWTAGDIDRAHVRVLADARSERTAELFARDEPMLVDGAKTLSFPAFVRLVAYWSQHADPDSCEDRAAAQKAKRRFHLSQSWDGMWFGDLILDPIGGSIVDAVLNAIEQELFAADRAQAEGNLLKLPRSAGQRRADALVEMATRAATAPADGRRPAPLFTVVVDYPTLAGRICELANRTVVTPGSLVPYLDEALIERIVFDGGSRVLDVGVTRRLFTGATRRAIEVRDLECFHPSCHIPANQCQIDHKQPHSQGGLTDQYNGRPGCDYHNNHRPPWYDPLHDTIRARIEALKRV
jgi:hypothetical protein